MLCPVCAADGTRVIDSRPADAGATIRRRRACPVCGHRFTTYERPEAVVMVLKRSGRVEPFQPAKLRAGLERSLAGRPVAPGTLDHIVDELEILALNEAPQVTSERLGREALARLRVLDEVAYLRFASVYKSFRDATDFQRELTELEVEQMGSAQVEG